MTRNEFVIDTHIDGESSWELVEGYTMRFYAVHRGWKPNGKYASTWTVTHLATGLAVWSHILNVEKAKAVAVWMESNCPWDEKQRFLDGGVSATIMAKCREIVEGK